jgi:uncharacterized protein YbbC (DUF1343 family)
MNTKFFFLFSFIFFLGCNISQVKDSNIKTGLDQINDYSQLFKNKQIGIITNHTAYNSKGQYITDVFADLEYLKVTALFGPEHGLRGNAAAGDLIDSAEDVNQNIPIYSLYGEIRKPTPKMLNQVDLLVYDIQDIGARYFTYISTMALAMEAAAEQGIPFVVLDRPNPINGQQVEGNILEKEFSSFVGMYPIPVRHGMTVGELARMFNEEGWLTGGVKVELTVIPLKNWKRNLWYDQTGLNYIKPSPNLPTLLSATAYPGTCLLEGSNVSEGRGTPMPFLLFGAPWIESSQLSRLLNELNLAGIKFSDTTFTPVSIPGTAENPKYQDTLCPGIKVRITDREMFIPYRSGIFIVKTIHDLYPDHFGWRTRHFDRLCGTDQIRLAIDSGTDIESLVNSWQKKLDEFKMLREKYLLY